MSVKTKSHKSAKEEEKMKNELTAKLGIEHPVIQGGMMEIAGARLAAAVSNAGGLGTLGQKSSAESWREEIRKTKELTDKPFAVNLPMHTPELEKKVDIILEEGVKIVVTAAGNPARVLPLLKEGACTVMHVVASLKQAKKVAEAGVDVVIAEGGESGGMVAKDRVSTMVLVPLVASAVSVPVVAAGGIGDGRGLLAALALGAQGIQMGTAFIATEECEASPEWKEALIRAAETDTAVVPRGPAQGRVLKDEILPGVMAGQVTGMIQKIEKAGELVRRVVEEAEAELKKVEKQFEG